MLSPDRRRRFRSESSIKRIIPDLNKNKKSFCDLIKVVNVPVVGPIKN